MSLPESKATLLKKFVNFTCENCRIKKESNELEIHRIRRGNQGGLYQLRNIMVLCKVCHRAIHAGEFRWK